MKENRNLSSPKKGMNRDSAPYNLQENEYSFALNTIFESESGDNYNPKNESSNILAATFPDGYKVVGVKNDFKADRTLYWITNPDTKISEIGFIKKGGVYTTLVEDSHDKGLNFDIYKPIKKIELKYEKLGTTAYWVDDNNPDRYINLSSVKDFFTEGRLDVNKLRIDKQHTLPTITPVSIEAGGQLQKGVYEVSLTYCDKLGNEIAGYICTTNPIHIFDNNNRVIAEEEISEKTNQAIKVRVDNLDSKYNYYKVIVVQRLIESVSYFIEGIHPVNDKEVIIHNLRDKQRTDINKLLSTKTTWVRSEGITSSNGYLFRYGLTAEKEWNLQPISNLLGSFVRWQTVAAKESLYNRGEASSLYKGYFRDEVYPLSWRIKTNTGYISALFPLVSRPPVTYLGEQGEVIDEMATVENLDTKSVNELNPECSTEERNKYWQFYNTAHDVQRCDNLEEEVETVKVQQSVIKYCVSEEVNNISKGELYLDLSRTENYRDLASYIEENEGIISYNLPQVGDEDYRDYDNERLETALADIVEGVNCEPYYKKKENGGNCEGIELVDEVVYLSKVEGESVTYLPKDTSNYKRSKVGAYMQLYKTGTDGEPKIDEDAPAGVETLRLTMTNDFSTSNPYLTTSEYFGSPIFARQYNTEADKCSYAIKLPHKTEATEASTPIISRWYGGETREELIGDIPSEAVVVGLPENARFSDNLHKGAVWFQGSIDHGDRAIIELTKYQKSDRGDDLFGRLANTKVRVSIYTGRCSRPKFVRASVVDVSQGVFLEPQAVLSSEVENKQFYVVIDFPILSTNSGKFVTALVNGAFGVEIRAEEYKSAIVAFERITLDKRQKYVLDCEFEIPILDNCDPQPDQHGKFAYWESTESYPVNKELYDSSNLVIEQGDIPESVKRDFEKYFVAAKVGTKYVLKQETDLSGKNIRHFKFPDFNVAPFMSTNLLASFTEPIIYPLGVTIEKEVVEAFLDIAVKNELITQAQRDTVTSFEIFRGDRRINKSIIGKGLMYDMYKYKEDNSEDEILFSNFPYNDLGNNKLLYEDEKRNSFIAHPYKGKMNEKFTFHSPEFDFYSPNVGAEVKIEAYQYGSSRGNFSPVENHPEWVILGEKSYHIANVLATLEFALEKAIRFTENSVQAAQGLWFQGGVVVGSGAVGAGVGFGLATALEVISGILYAAPQIGKYRYQWLQIFRDLGKPENFVSQYASEGFYNYAEPNNWMSGAESHKGHSLRGVSSGKRLRPGKFTFTERDGKQLKVNNLDREDSVFLTFGEKYTIKYPQEYINYDNSLVDSFGSSRAIQSENGNCVKGKGEEIHKKIASPYVSVKNYVPFQYGTVNSIKWLPTSTTVQLDKSNTCYTVFGGDIFISRYALKRKTPLFNTTAFGSPDMLPFEYSRYNNIGHPRFFCDYELGNEKNIGDIFFPDFESNYVFDCHGSDAGSYIKSPSKMYLNYYGIPNFLVESEINLNLRYSKKEARLSFYPEAGDFNDWTQEKNVSIKEPNRLFYNNVYSSVVTTPSYRTLPDFYNKEEFDIIFDSPSGVIFSMQDVSESDLNDPWLIYRPLDFHQFPTSYGKLMDLKGISSAQIIGRFENTTVLFNAVNQFKDAQDATSRELGTGGIFYTRPQEFSSTELGYRGSSTYQIISNETGHYYPDAERGQIFQYTGGNDAPQEISANGMKAWFKEHLPFKVKTSIVENYEDIDTDNAFNGLGITMGWDSKFDRVFLTKVDYIPVKDMSYFDGKFMVFDCNPIQLCKFVNKEQTIQEKLDQGYKFIEENCKLIFQKYLETCEYETIAYRFPENEKQALVEQGYTLKGQTKDTLRYEKVEDACDPDSKQTEIEALIKDGYNQHSVDGCTITFVKEVCSFTNQQDEIDALLSDGYSLIDETECSKVFEKPEAQTLEANDDYVEADEGEAVTFNVIANDTSSSTQALAILDFTQPQYGTVTKVSSGSFKYVHDGSNTTSDSFKYRATNDVGVTEYATVHISIRPFELTLTPTYTSLPPLTTGETTLTVYSTHNWTAELEKIELIAGSVTVDKLSGTPGTTTITISYVDAKAVYEYHVTSKGVTKTYTLIID